MENWIGTAGRAAGKTSPKHCEHTHTVINESCYKLHKEIRLTEGQAVGCCHCGIRHPKPSRGLNSHPGGMPPSKMTGQRDKHAQPPVCPIPQTHGSSECCRDITLPRMQHGALTAMGKQKGKKVCLQPHLAQAEISGSGKQSPPSTTSSQLRNQKK